VDRYAVILEEFADVVDTGYYVFVDLLNVQPSPPKLLDPIRFSRVGVVSIGP